VKIRWTRTALADLDSIYARLATDDQDVAQHIIERVEQAVGVLVRVRDIDGTVGLFSFFVAEYLA
jgi:plasmid stabilization system protein ParE